MRGSANDWFRLWDGSESDLPLLMKVDGGFSTEWVLFLQRRGRPDEQTIELRWRRAKPAGSRRGAFTADAQGELEELRTELRRSDRLLIAEADGRIVGYLMLGSNWNRTAEITLIIIDAAYRGRGLGSRFVREAEAFARERGLRAIQWEAQNDNRNALEFALAQGFRIAGFHDALYHNRGYERQAADEFRGLAVFLTKELD